MKATVKIIIRHHCGYGHQQTHGRGHQGFGNAGHDRRTAATFGQGQVLKGVNDAQHRAKQTDEGGIGPQSPQKIQSLTQLQIYPDTLGFHSFVGSFLAVGNLIETGQQDLRFR